MNMQKLRAEVQSKQQMLKALELRAANQETQAKTAKAKARAAKLNYKKLRKEAKQAKGGLLELREQIEQQSLALAKAERKLDKGLRKPAAAKKSRCSAKVAGAAVRKRSPKAPAIEAPQPKVQKPWANATVPRPSSVAPQVRA